MALQCPNCGADSVEHVASVVAAQTHVGSVPVRRHYELGVTQIRFDDLEQVVLRTSLANELAPPQRLSQRFAAAESPEAVEQRLLKGMVKGGTRILHTVSLWGLIVCGLLFWVFSETDQKTHMIPIWNPQSVMFGLGVLLFLAVYLITGRQLKHVVYARSQLSQAQGRRLDEILRPVKERYEVYQNALSRQTQARVRYMRLARCVSCGKIFDPEDSLKRTFAPAIIETYIFGG